MPGSTVTTKPGRRGRARRSDFRPNWVLLGLALVADVDLAQVLHVVDVEPHHVAFAAGEEQGMGAAPHGLVETRLSSGRGP